ncbi:MAG: biotin--[acetyl-CoA-carboxylase] ligase [Desulfomonilaceae bacterium]|jgi:BirA family biotin operon repressor/biotin-[acetyl-CoA-carboxylase] ligase
MFRPELIVLEETTSTQEVAVRMALDGGVSGATVMALNQTKGRGRSGSQWISPPGKNLAFSVIVRPNIEILKAPLIGMLSAICAAETVDDFCRPFRAQLKWPNDVLVEGKKIAGIISEARFLGKIVDFIVVGVGLNVNSRAEDFPDQLRESLTSFFSLTGKIVDLRTIATTFLQRMSELLNRVENVGPDFIPLQWERRWVHKGMKLVRDGITGTATALDSDGSLLLKLSDGKILKISSGTTSCA